MYRLGLSPGSMYDSGPKRMQFAANRPPRSQSKSGSTTRPVMTRMSSPARKRRVANRPFPLRDGATATCEFRDPAAERKRGMPRVLRVEIVTRARERERESNDTLRDLAMRARRLQGRARRAHIRTIAQRERTRGHSPNVTMRLAWVHAVRPVVRPAAVAGAIRRGTGRSPA